MSKTWLAAGFNAHHQLDETVGNLEHFQSTGKDVSNILLSTWSSLVTQSSSNAVVSSGHQKWTHQFDDGVVLHSPIGDHDGFQAALDNKGLLYVVSPSKDGAEPHLKLMGTYESPSLAFMAMAGNGRVVCAFTQAPNGNLTHVGDFPSFNAFKTWHSSPTEPSTYPVAHHMVPGTPKQLVAGAGSFAMLMNDESLYTWGDPRHRSLARSTVEPDATPANKPGVVEALAGLRLRKIVLGGWMGGAVSEDGAGYIWGSSMPGKQAAIECLRSRDDERVTLIELNSEAEPDVVDLAIGDGHAALVTASGDVFVVGENNHGQLGLSADRTFEPHWSLLPDADHITQVVCGPKSTFILRTA